MPFADSIAAQVGFLDGSCGQLIYTAEGDAGFPKETITVFAAGVTAEITNFQEMAIFRNRKKSIRSFTSKGHAEQMAAWVSFLNASAPHPFPYPISRQSMLLTFAVLESLREGRSVSVR